MILNRAVLVASLAAALTVVDPLRNTEQQAPSPHQLVEACNLLKQLRLVPVRTQADEHIATGPKQLWSWGINWIKTTVHGWFYSYTQHRYLQPAYHVWSVHDDESAEYAAALFSITCVDSQLDPKGRVFRSDIGGPMRGSTRHAEPAGGTRLPQPPRG
ncbi:hypothetical protein ACSRUE_06575 [Sorangium sp. KYC3313]|uniref:hypothetical protein n=1 Tax=Sorangium sp. KYC3313 TaxID=3449740 RepID=UPI003F8AF7F5